MLRKDTLRQIKEHGWLEIEKKHPNRYQARSRVRNQAIEAIDELTLMAQKLPDDTLKDVFNYTNVSNLIESILHENELGDSGDNGARRIQLAARMIEIGIATCINEYRSKIEQDSVLNELTINHLLRAVDICNAISLKVRLPLIEKEAKEEGLVYLFDWNGIKEIHESKISELRGGDTKKFIRLLSDIYYHENGELCPADVINKISFDQNQSDPNSNVLFEFTDFYGDRCHGSISLIIEKKTAHLSMYTEDNVHRRQILAKRDFVIKVKHGNTYVCKKEETTF